MYIIFVNMHALSVWQGEPSKNNMYVLRACSRLSSTIMAAKFSNDQYRGGSVHCSSYV